MNRKPFRHCTPLDLLRRGMIYAYTREAFPGVNDNARCLIQTHLELVGTPEFAAWLRAGIERANAVGNRRAAEVAAGMLATIPCDQPLPASVRGLV